MALLEAGKRGLRRLDPPSGGRPGLVEHQVGSTRLDAVAAQLPSGLGLHGGLHDVSEGVAAALEDVRPQHLVHPHFLHGSAMDGLLGVVVFDEVDGEPVLMSVRHGYRRAERNRWVVAEHVWELYNLYFLEPDGFLSFLDIGDDVGTGAIVFFWY